MCRCCPMRPDGRVSGRVVHPGPLRDVCATGAHHCGMAGQWAHNKSGDAVHGGCMTHVHCTCNEGTTVRIHQKIFLGKKTETYRRGLKGSIVGTQTFFGLDTPPPPGVGHGRH